MCPGLARYRAQPQPNGDTMSETLVNGQTVQSSAVIGTIEDMVWYVNQLLPIMSKAEVNAILEASKRLVNMARAQQTINQ